MIDSTREGKVDAAYKLRVEGTRKNELCFVTVIFECMRRENGDLEVPLIDRNSAVHDDDEMTMRMAQQRESARLSNKLCGWAVQPTLNDQLRRDRRLITPPTILPSPRARLAAAHLLSIWPYAPT